MKEKLNLACNGRLKEIFLVPSLAEYDRRKELVMFYLDSMSVVVMASLLGVYYETGFYDGIHFKSGDESYTLLLSDEDKTTADYQSLEACKQFLIRQTGKIIGDHQSGQLTTFEEAFSHVLKTMKAQKSANDYAKGLYNWHMKNVYQYSKDARFFATNYSQDLVMALTIEELHEIITTEFYNHVDVLLHGDDLVRYNSFNRLKKRVKIKEELREFERFCLLTKGRPHIRPDIKEFWNYIRIKEACDSHPEMW